MAGHERSHGTPRASAPAAPPGARAPRRRRWLIGLGVLAAVALAAAAMSALILTGAEGGEAAVERAQRAAASGLDDMARDAARDGQELDVNWTAVPDMSESNYLVTVRVRMRPSGASSIGEFMVAGDRVTPQGAFARRLMGPAGRPAP